MTEEKLDGKAGDRLRVVFEGTLAQAGPHLHLVDDDGVGSLMYWESRIRAERYKNAVIYNLTEGDSVSMCSACRVPLATGTCQHVSFEGDQVVMSRVAYDRLCDELGRQRDNAVAFENSSISPLLLRMLDLLGDEYGPLGVALAAATLTSSDVLVRQLTKDRAVNPEAKQSPEPWSGWRNGAPAPAMFGDAVRWIPNVSPGSMRTLRNMVACAVQDGAGCWESVESAGGFRDDESAMIVDGLVEWLEANYTEELPQPVDSLRRDLERLLNRHSVDNYCNTPDYVLASYLLASIEAYVQAMRERKAHKKGKKDGER